MRVYFACLFKYSFLIAQTDSTETAPRLDFSLLKGDWYWAESTAQGLVLKDTFCEWLRIGEPEFFANHDAVWQAYTCGYEPDEEEIFPNQPKDSPMQLLFLPPNQIKLKSETKTLRLKIISLDPERLVLQHRFKQKEPFCWHLVRKPK